MNIARCDSGRSRISNTLTFFYKYLTSTEVIFLILNIKYLCGNLLNLRHLRAILHGNRAKAHFIRFISLPRLKSRGYSRRKSSTNYGISLRIFNFLLSIFNFFIPPNPIPNNPYPVRRLILHFVQYDQSITDFKLRITGLLFLFIIHHSSFIIYHYFCILFILKS